jgi:hypothetical protein
MGGGEGEEGSAALKNLGAFLKIGNRSLDASS